MGRKKEKSKQRYIKRMLSALLAGALAGGVTVSGAAGRPAPIYAENEPQQALVSVSTYAGTGDFGEEDASTSASTFRTPRSILVSGDGTVLVADSLNHKIRKIGDKAVTTAAGPLIALEKDGMRFPVGAYLNGKARASFFNGPEGLAADAQGNVFIADADNHAIRKLGTDGTVTTVAGNGVPGDKDGNGDAARFRHPRDVAVAMDGTLYVADTLNHVIRKIAADGTVTTLTARSERTVKINGKDKPAGDYADGEIAKAKFNEPSGLAIDPKGNLYVSDTGNQRIRYIDFGTGHVTTAAGNGALPADVSEHAGALLYASGDYADGPAANALFNYPVGLALTKEGGLLIADSANHSIRYLLKGSVSTIAGDADRYTGEADGIERSASLHLPTDVAVTAEGTILVADSFNNKIREIRYYQLPVSLPADETLKVVYGQTVVPFDTPPEFSGERMMVPVRAIAEAVGYTVEYAAENNSVRMFKGDVSIEMRIGFPEVTRMVKGEIESTLPMDAAPYMKETEPVARIYVPVRFFAEQIGLDVQWNEAHQTAILRDKFVP